MNNKNRVIFLDNLRGIVILLVVIFHASLTCMEQSPTWWYIHNESVSIIFSLFVVIADTFMMPTLFLVSGIVQAKQSAKSNPTLRIKKRARRLLLPWIIGVLVVGPYLSIKMANSLGYKTSWNQMITNDFWGDLFTQGPYWYLSLLFAFFLITSIIPKRFIESLQVIFQKKRTVYFFLLFCLIIGFWIGSTFWGADSWINFVYVLSFQPSRILTYFAFFILGLAISKQNTLSNISGWKWNLLCILSAALLVVLKGNPDDTPIILMSTAYALVTLSWTLRLYSFAEQKLNKSTNLLNWLGNNSFTLYLIHLPVQIIIGSIILDYKLNSVMMWISQIASSLIVTLVISKLKDLLFKKQVV